MFLTTGNKNQQQSMIRRLYNHLSNKNRNNDSKDFSKNQFSGNINRNGLVFSDENIFHQNNILNYMNIHYVIDLSQNVIIKPSKYARNSNVNGFHRVNAINQVRSHSCETRLKILHIYI